jgi:integrase
MIGSEPFFEAYQAAQQHKPVGDSRTKVGSVSAAVAGYYQTLAFRSLAPNTQQMRRAIYERFRAQHGDKRIATLPQAFIVSMLNKMGPHAAKNWLKALRALAQFAVAEKMLVADPTLGIRLPRTKSAGFHTWDERQIQQYEKTHPFGSKARLAFALALFTAQRRSDIVKMGRQHISNGTLSVIQQKTGTPLRVPLHPALLAVLEATPSEHLTFLTTRSGQPYSGNDFSEQFRAWCDEAGLPKECTAHGLRKAACRRLAESGCSASEIMSISGHKTLAEVQRYVAEAEQERMARNAMARIKGGKA